MISVHQILPVTHCVVIVVEQKVSDSIVQSQSQGGIAEDCKSILKVSKIQTLYLLPLVCSEVTNPTVTDSTEPTVSSHYH